MAIPKTIHYCWFGRNPKPKLENKCIASWREKCPDYEIVEWNEDTFKIEEAPLFVRQAYEVKKWAFVADYVRFYALVQYGGIYLDTDVELLKPLDAFLQHQAFAGLGDAKSLGTAIIGCEKGFPFFEQFLHYYDNIPFIKADGTYDMTNNTILFSNYFLENGMKMEDSYQEIEHCALYPSDVFFPRDWASGKVKITDNSVLVHWASGSWLSPEKRKWAKKVQARTRATNRLHFITHLPNYIMLTLLGEEKYENLKKIIRGGVNDGACFDYCPSV